MRAVDEKGRARIVEMMWELVYADDHVSEFEESVIWRSADLLGISSNERIALKNRVAGSRIAPNDCELRSRDGGTRRTDHRCVGRHRL